MSHKVLSGTLLHLPRPEEGVTLTEGAQGHLGGCGSKAVSDTLILQLPQTD